MQVFETQEKVQAQCSAYNKGVKAILWEKESFFDKCCWTNWIAHIVKVDFDLRFQVTRAHAMMAHKIQI